MRHLTATTQSIRMKTQVPVPGPMSGSCAAPAAAGSAHAGWGG